MLFLKAKQNENLTASGSHYYSCRYWSRHNEMRNDVLCLLRYVRDAEMLVKSLAFPHVCLWLSVASAVALGSRSLEWISAKLFSSSDSFNCLHWELRLQRCGCFLHFKNSVLPKPRAGEYECVLINRRCVSRWDMNSTRAAREPDIEANPRSPLQAWY